MSHDHNNIKLRIPPYCTSHGDVITWKQNPVV